MSEYVAEVLAALKSGQTLFSICGGRTKNGQRHQRITYREPLLAYCASHPEYGREGPAVSEDVRLVVQKALEKAGVEFIPEKGGGAGVRLAKRAKRK